MSAGNESAVPGNRKVSGAAFLYLLDPGVEPVALFAGVVGMVGEFCGDQACDAGIAGVGVDHGVGVSGEHSRSDRLEVVDGVAEFGTFDSGSGGGDAADGVDGVGVEAQVRRRGFGASSPAGALPRGQ